MASRILFTEEEDNIILDMRDKGLTFREISEVLVGRSEGSICTRLNLIKEKATENIVLDNLKLQQEVKCQKGLPGNYVEGRILGMYRSFILVQLDKYKECFDYENVRVM